MPTENRSSNTEQMVSVPRELLEQIHRFEWNGEGASDAGCTLSGILSGRITYAQPAAQHQGDPIVVEAVAVTRADDDEGLRLEWLLEGGIAALEFPGQVLLVAHGKVTDDNGSGEVYLHPPTSDGFSAGDMADQGAKAFEVEQLRAEVERLKGLLPEWPPRPPDGQGLPRYGLRWNGPQQPLAVPMDDGYWTPWHLAASAEPSAPTERDQGIPGTSFQRLNMLANQGE